MTTPHHSVWLVLLALLLATSAACGSTDAPVTEDPAATEDPCADVGTFAPGASVTFCGGELRLGDDASATITALGLPQTAHDLGEQGTRYAWPDHGVAAHADASGSVVAIHLLPGFAGTSELGVGFGSSAADVDAALGAAEVEPFLGLWRYPELGLALQWSGDAVAGMHVLPPTEPAVIADGGEADGGTLPDLALSTCDGQPVHLSDHLVDKEAAWIGVQAGWCGSCGSQRDVMQTLHEQLAADGLAVVLVLGEDAVPGSGQVPGDWCDKFTTVNGLTFPVLRDPGFAATHAWAGAVVPVQLVVDAELTVVQQDTGWADWMAETYETLLAGLVQ